MILPHLDELTVLALTVKQELAEGIRRSPRRRVLRLAAVPRRVSEIPVRRAGSTHDGDAVRELAHVTTVDGPESLERRARGDERFAVLAARAGDDVE